MKDLHVLKRSKDISELTIMDRIQNDIDRVAKELKKEGNDISKSVNSKLNDMSSSYSHRTIDYTYPGVIYQLRSAHLVGLFVQALALYLWSRELGLTGFLLPFIVICLNFYLVFKRWYYSIDGRYDFQKLIGVNKNQLRLHYFIALFGSLILSLLAHFLGPDLSGGFTTFLYNISNYLSVSCAICIAAVDCYEGYKTKNF
ncbi:unnamed protein product [Bursaphelenchus xylophilus]|uniref:(pine wood nematode) hypothetical protein n=1 Tax=Bursaphelenchus xylophilus TaxID=6326 RepID=A0A1I7S5W8_BURXY|nr:unnamed protein product [Bursaphelenchus xylophilus]CAG9082598.1 unnamed protein product [Bursaphelenchus xylophilus]